MNSQIKLMSWIHDLRAGGAETSLLVELKQLRERGFDVSVGIVSFDRAIVPRFTAEGIPVFDLGMGSRLSRGWRIIQILRRERPDIVEVVLFWPNIVVRPIARLLGIKVVTQLANEEYGPVQRQESRYGATGVRLAQFADLLTARFANHFRSVSFGVESTMKKRLLLQESKISVIHIAREIPSLGRRNDTRRTKARATLELDDDAFVIMTTGRHDAQKNQSVAIHAASVVAQHHSKVIFLIAGRFGHMTTSMEETIRKSTPRVDVRLLGERSDVAELLCAADCYVMPSLWEGFSGAVVEAMALEVPLVLSDIASMREVTQGFAWYFLPNDSAKCAELLVDVAAGNYPQSFIDSCRARAEEELDIHSITTQLEMVYRNLITK